MTTKALAAIEDSMMRLKSSSFNVAYNTTKSIKSEQPADKLQNIFS
jgi:hypothetical protein